MTYKPLGDILEIQRGRRLTTSQLSDEFEYPVYHGGIEKIGNYTEYNREADTVMIINVGASAGTIGYCNEKFWSSDGCFCIKHNPKYNNRFLYYLLCTHENYLKSKVRKAGIPTLDNKVIEKLNIPEISLEQQEAIVYVLDNFDKLANDLTEGLPAEIELRKKQYEYYRDKLLTFNE